MHVCTHLSNDKNFIEVLLDVDFRKEKWHIFTVFNFSAILMLKWQRIEVLFPNCNDI